MYQEGQNFFQDLESDSRYYDAQKVDNYMAQKPATLGPTQALGMNFSSVARTSQTTNPGQNGERQNSLNILQTPGDLVNQTGSICDNQSGSQVVSSAVNSSWMSYFLSQLPSIVSTRGGPDLRDKLEQDCRLFMRGMMDECTHLANFSVPVDPELIVIMRAENDAYVPYKGYLTLHDIWPGSKVRTLPCGHVAGHVINKNRKAFR